MTALLAPFLPYIIAAGAALLAMLGLYAKGKSSGRKAEREKLAREEQKARDVADQVDNDIGAITPSQARERLSRWSKS